MTVSGPTDPVTDPDGAADLLDRLVANFETGAVARFAGWRGIGSDWHDFVATIGAGGLDPAAVLIVAMAVLAIGAAATWGLAGLLAGRNPSFYLARAVLWPACAFAVSILAIAVLRWQVPDPALRGALASCAVIGTMIACVGGWLIGRDGARSRGSFLLAWRRDLFIAIGLSLLGLAVLALLRAWNASLGLRDAFGTIGVSLPGTVLLALAYLRNRRAVTLSLSWLGHSSPLRHRFAGLWPAIAVACILLAFLFTQIALTVGKPIRGGPILLSLLLALAGPHIDVFLEQRSRRAASLETGAFVSALWRTLRVASAAAILLALVSIWLLPVLDAAGLQREIVILKAAEIVLIVLVLALFWNWIGILAARFKAAPGVGTGGPEADPAAIQSRLGTVGPLILGLVKATLLALGILTILVALGVNVWPLITGFSIFGLAVGFGSQTLVKDLVSGLFFLIDDAFRRGEYIETSGAKGTVEKISLRSVSLRHPRGAVATIPYGQIGKIQNYSREWVIEKLLFRVAFDTDIEKVRKLFKKVGQDIADDPELSADLLEPFKSQGIGAVEDGTLVIRAKFKAKAGRQFQIRKAALIGVQRAFRENGIVAVPKPLSLPDA